MELRDSVLRGAISAPPEEKERFFELVRGGGTGVSANCLNFNDLVDTQALAMRLGEMAALLDADISFLYTNVHCHNGMYPLYQNQKPFFWEDERGRRLLVFSAGHPDAGRAARGRVWHCNVSDGLIFADIRKGVRSK